MGEKSMILVRHGEKQELAKLFKTTYPAVRRALSGDIKTDLQIKIRKAAIERGGKIITFK